MVCDSLVWTKVAQNEEYLLIVYSADISGFMITQETSLPTVISQVLDNKFNAIHI